MFVRQSLGQGGYPHCTLKISREAGPPVSVVEKNLLHRTASIPFTFNLYISQNHIDLI